MPTFRLVYSSMSDQIQMAAFATPWPVPWISTNARSRRLTIQSLTAATRRELTFLPPRRMSFMPIHRHLAFTLLKWERRMQIKTICLASMRPPPLRRPKPVARGRSLANLLEEAEGNMHGYGESNSVPLSTKSGKKLEGKKVHQNHVKV
ncbi:hypothetical protein D9613_011419 [Agrocybe pediades]|uniref:Uncharacterized protein n=1 Tax=Agrocybe pediades TaxID=84607 RepID=A0A8H4VME8_9AGAR|nr:hypothetical protein D9613_011419 [Agrocybe pediades]